MFNMQRVNPVGNDTGIIQQNWVNTMAADDLAPCVTRSSIAMLYII